MDFERRNGFEQIKVSDKLDDVVEKVINKAKKDKKKAMLKRKFIKYSMAASLVIIFVSSIKFIPVFAQAVSNVTYGIPITHELQFHYDKNIGTAVKDGLSQYVNESKTDQNVKVTINNMVSDDKNLFVFYTLNGKTNKEGLKKYSSTKF